MTEFTKLSSRILTNTLLFLSILILSALTTAAQCTLKQSELPAAPELLGFHLGMTKDEVKKRVPQTEFGRTDAFGVVKTTINPYFDQSIDKTKFENVRSVSLDLLDDHVISIWIGFDENFKAATIDEFVKVISESLHISGPWSDAKLRGRQIRCSDFQLTVTIVARGPSFRIVDVAAEDTIAARRLAKEEEQEAAAAETGQTENDGTEAESIVGDKATKTYFPSGCQALKSVSNENRITFKTPEEAEKARYKLSSQCH